MDVARRELKRILVESLDKGSQGKDASRVGVVASIEFGLRE